MEPAVASPDRHAQTALAFLKKMLADCRPRRFAVRLWDGTAWEPEPGVPAAFTMAIRRPGALRRIFLRPSELSLGEAYIHGDLDIEGDLESACALGDLLAGMRPSAAERLRMARQLLSIPQGDPPAAGRRKAARLRGEVHSRQRDRAVTWCPSARRCGRRRTAASRSATWRACGSTTP